MDMGHTKPETPEEETEEETDIVTLIVPQLDSKSKLNLPSSDTTRSTQSLSIIIEPSGSGLSPGK